MQENDNFVNLDVDSISLDFLFDFIENLDPNIYEKYIENEKEFVELTKIPNLRNKRVEFNQEQKKLIKELLMLVNQWFHQNKVFFSAMAHPELVKEKIDSWPDDDRTNLILFKSYVDYWWDSENRSSFVESFQDSLAIYFGSQGIDFFEFLIEQFDTDEFLDTIYNFVAYRDMVDTFIDVSFTDNESGELICPLEMLDDVLLPYIKENRILMPLLYARQNF